MCFIGITVQCTTLPKQSVQTWNTHSYGVPNSPIVDLTHSFGETNSPIVDLTHSYGVPNSSIVDLTQNYGVPNSPVSMPFARATVLRSWMRVM